MSNSKPPGRSAQVYDGTYYLDIFSSAPNSGACGSGSGSGSRGYYIVQFQSGQFVILETHCEGANFAPISGLPEELEDMEFYEGQVFYICCVSSY